MNPKSCFPAKRSGGSRKIRIREDERFRTVADDAPGMLFEFVLHADGSANTPFVTGGVQDLYGVDRDSARSDTGLIHRMVHPNDAEGLTQSILSSASSLETWTWEGRIVRLDGATRWIRGQAKPAKRSNGDVVWHGVVIDVTEAKQTQMALAETQDLYRMLVERAFDGVFLIEPDGRISVWNPKAVEMFGWTAEEAIGQSALELLVPERWRTPATKNLFGPTRTRSKSFQRQSEIWVQRKDGSEFAAELRLTTVAGTPNSVRVVLVRDITTRLHWERDLCEARDLADRANRSQSEFVSRMSHELRTPLNAILGFAQLLEMENLEADAKDSVDNIVRAGRHLLALINEVLDLAKVESGTASINLEPVDLGVVTQEVLSMLKPLAAVKAVTVRFDPSSSSCLGLADPQRTRQVIVNLVSNAIKYNRCEGTVFASVREHPETVELRIVDNGFGISSEQIERIFEPFHRGDADQSAVEGTGIGLTLTKRFVESMGGRIEVRSEEGIGSTFSVHLPRHPHPQPHPHVITSEPSCSGLETIQPS